MADTLPRRSLSRELRRVARVLLVASAGRRARPAAARAVVAAVLATAALAAPGGAYAAVGDTASGVGTSENPICYSGTMTFNFSVSGASNGAANGTFTFACPPSEEIDPDGGEFTGTASCLDTARDSPAGPVGDYARIGGTVTQSTYLGVPVGQGLNFTVVDFGPGGPADEFSQIQGGATCRWLGTSYSVDGDIAVTRAPQCSDEIDNDFDGATDFPADPGCTSADDGTESPDPPPPPQCSDGTDNDGDGTTDFPADPGCTSDTDDSEAPNPATGPICESQPATVYVSNGAIVGGPDSGQPYTGTLRGTAGPDVINGTVAADTVNAGGGADIVCALGGKDTVTGDDDNDRLIGGPGNDNVSGGAGVDNLQGRAGNDILTGGTQADRFVGGAGTDTATDFSRAQGDTRVSIP